MVESPLWTEAHAPDLADIPQPSVRDRLRRAVAEPMNLVISGPPGSGKTAAVRALARETHDDPDNDYVELNVADFFDRTKKEIREDPRFGPFLQGEIPWVRQLSTAEKQARSKRYKSDWSKAAMINHVLTESAAHAPSSGEYRTILLDNAEAIREDFQQALRRVMERHHRTTQIVIATQQPSKLIPPIRSRCFPVPVRATTHGETVNVLRGIVEAEDVEFDEDGLEFLAGYADGDLRRAILGAQTTAEMEGSVTMQSAYDALGDIGVGDHVRGMLADAEAGEFTDARSTLDDLLVDEGLSGQEVLDELLDVARERYTGRELAELHRVAGTVDMDLHEGTNDRIHLGHLLAEIGRQMTEPD